MANAKPGDRTGGDKDKEAAHRTPAQAKKRNGPGGRGKGQGAVLMPEQGAQASGKILQGDLRGGGASGIDGGQHGLSNAPLGRIEGGVEPRSPVLGSEKQACRQEGATVVASPMEQTGMGARNAHELRGTHLGVMMPEGTANEQPISALTRALGAMESALPKAVQTNVQAVQSAVHVAMHGTDASTAPGPTDTPQGGMLSEGTANAQPDQALMSALGARDGSNNLSQKQACRQEGATVVASPPERMGMSARDAHELRGTHLGVMMPVGTANEQPISALTRALGAMESALPKAVQTHVQAVQSAAHADMHGKDASHASELTDTPLGGTMPEGTASLRPDESLTRELGAREGQLPVAHAPLQPGLQMERTYTAHVGMQGEGASIAPEISGTPQGGVMTGAANEQPNEALTCALGARDALTAGGNEPQQPVQEGPEHGNEIDEMIRKNSGGKVPSEEEMASRYVLPKTPQLGETACEGPRGVQPMVGLISSEAADSQLNRGGSNPFTGVSIGLPWGMGRGRRGGANTPQPLPKPRGGLGTVIEETPGAAHGPSIASLGDADGPGVKEGAIVAQKMRRGMSVGSPRSPTGGIGKAAYMKESRSMRKERLEGQGAQQQQQHQQVAAVYAYPASDPIHGVPQWVWDLNANGIEGAKLLPPNVEQGIALHAITGAIKGGLGLPPGEATRDLWDHYGAYIVGLVWDPTIPYPTDLVWKGGDARYKPGDLSQWWGDPGDGRGHRALTPWGPNSGNWQKIDPPHDHVLQIHAWDVKHVGESDQGNEANGGFDVGRGDFPPLPTTRPATNGQTGQERGGDLLMQRGAQPTQGEGWTQVGSQREKAKGKDRGKEKSTTAKPAWVDAMKATRADTADREKGMVAPWMRAAAGVTAEGERGPDGVVRGSDEDWSWEEWDKAPPPESWETEEDNDEFPEEELMDGVPQTGMTEEELRKAELLMEEMEEERRMQEGEGGPPPDGGGGEEERVNALREDDWTNALKLVQKSLTERGQAEGIFGRDFDRIESGDSPVARATDGHCGNEVLGRLTLWTGGKVDVDLGGEEMNETALNCFAYSYGEQWNVDFAEDKTNQEQWNAMITLVKWRITKVADLTGIMELIHAMWTGSNDGHGGPQYLGEWMAECWKARETPVGQERQPESWISTSWDGTTALETTIVNLHKWEDATPEAKRIAMRIGGALLRVVKVWTDMGDNATHRNGRLQLLQASAMEIDGIAWNARGSGRPPNPTSL